MSQTSTNTTSTTTTSSSPTLKSLNASTSINGMESILNGSSTTNVLTTKDTNKANPEGISTSSVHPHSMDGVPEVNPSVPNTAQEPVDGEVKATSVDSRSTEEKIDHAVHDLRVAVVGNVDSGKSTLIGVLTGGNLDDGRGAARSRVFLHKHEHENGRTSCASHHIMGYTKEGSPVHCKSTASSTSAVKTKSWKAVVDSSQQVVTFIDLAGHERYLKTTISGLSGCFPDYAMIIVNAGAGVTRMTREHLGVSLALNIPLIVVVSKIDMPPPEVLKQTKKQLEKVLKCKLANKLPVTIRSKDDIHAVLADSTYRAVPVFYTSAVTGQNIDLLHYMLSQAKPTRKWDAAINAPAELRIDEVFQVGFYPLYYLRCSKS